MKAPALAAIGILLLLGGCEDPRADMGEQPKYLPYQPSEFFADGTSARPLVAGVVPRGGANVPGVPYARPQPGEQEGRVRDVAPLTQSIPFPITPEIVARGQQRYGIFCAVCHGRLGNGQGMIVQRGFTPPPSFHVPRLQQAPDAHFFNVITHGYGAMFSYNDRIPAPDRWEIVAYIRVLQAATQALPGPAPQAVQEALRGSGDPNRPTGGGR